jgi:hypothetical protein
VHDIYGISHPSRACQEKTYKNLTKKRLFKTQPFKIFIRPGRLFPPPDVAPGITPVSGYSDLIQDCELNLTRRIILNRHFAVKEDHEPHKQDVFRLDDGE